MDKKTLFLALITGVGLVLWIRIGPLLEQKLGLSPSTQDVAVETEQTIHNQVVEKKGKAKSLDDPNPLSDEFVDNSATDTTETAVPVPNLPPENIANEELIMTVDPQNGIGEVNLIHHKENIAKDSPQVIIGDNTFASLNLSGVAKDWEFGAATVAKGDDSLIITRPVLGQKFSLQQSIHLSKDFQFKKTFKIINHSTEPLFISGLAVNSGQMKPISLGDAVGMMEGMDQGVDVYGKKDGSISTYFFADILEEAEKIEQEKSLPAGQGKYRLEIVEGGLQWVAVKNRYFAWIVDYEDGFKSCEVGYNVKKIVYEGKEETVHFVTADAYFYDFKVQPKASYEIELNCFAGPQKFGILNNLSHDKKQIMQLNLFMFMKVGWIGVISEWMLKALIYFYNILGNYGLAIIMLTIIVKAIFWRMTNKSTESMKKMSTLSPKIKEISEKYKDNPQVKQQKIMGLYREAGVNPVAGCLPLLLQMPVFIALFNALRGAIELRHSEFLWITDLSQPDTIFSIAGLDIRPLAIAWALSMFLQQRIVPSSADETQKKIMMFMPVVMLFICYGMPSGLTLYWTFSTLMSILQYYLNNKKASKIEIQTAAKAATG